MAAFREAAQLYAIDAQPDLNSALRIPGMLSTGDEEELGEDVTKARPRSRRRSRRSSQRSPRAGRRRHRRRKCGSAAATSASW